MKYTKVEIKLFLNDLRRFCKNHKQFHSEKNNRACVKTCPLYELKQETKKMNCYQLLSIRPDEVIDAVMDWRKFNPEETYKTVFLKKFPHTMVNFSNTSMCVGDIFGFACAGGDCADCWNREYEGDM